MSPIRKGRTASSRNRSASTAPDAITLLTKDHDKVRGLLKKLESAALRGDRVAETLLGQVDRELKIHTQVEEEIFYPAYHQAARTKQENELFFEAKEAHHVVDMMIPDVSGAHEGSEDFAGRAKVLKDIVEHHADEEEKQMFTRAKKLMGRDELRDLGRRIKERKEELGAE